MLLKLQKAFTYINEGPIAHNSRVGTQAWILELFQIFHTIVSSSETLNFNAVSITSSEIKSTSNSCPLHKMSKEWADCFRAVAEYRGGGGNGCKCRVERHSELRVMLFDEMLDTGRKQRLFTMKLLQRQGKHLTTITQGNLRWSLSWIASRWIHWV